MAAPDHEHNQVNNPPVWLCYLVAYGTIVTFLIALGVIILALTP